MYCLVFVGLLVTRSLEGKGRGAKLTWERRIIFLQTDDHTIYLGKGGEETSRDSSDDMLQEFRW